MTTGDNLVSVVIPVYNGETLLPATLASIFSQTYSSIEIVVVDDGSSDASLEVLRGYGDRVRVIAQNNAGAAAARNAGVRAARGEWIAFVDADDIWCHDKIERQLAACDGAVWCYTDSQFLGGVNDSRRDSELNDKYSGDVFEKLLCNNFIATSSVMIRREIFLEAGGFNQSLKSIEDWELWLRVAKRYPVAYLNEALVKYRIHSDSMSRSARKMLPCHMQVIDLVFKRDGIATNCAHLEPVARAQSLQICASIAEEEGDMGFALNCFVRACVWRPRSLRMWGRAGKEFVKYLLWSVGLRVFAGLWVNFDSLLPSGYQTLLGIA